MLPLLHVVRVAAAIGILIVMLGRESGRAHVLTSLIVAGALALVWSIVRRNLQSTGRRRTRV